MLALHAELCEAFQKTIFKIVFYSNQYAVLYKCQYIDFEFRPQTFLCVIFGQNFQQKNKILKFRTLGKKKDEI